MNRREALVVMSALASTMGGVVVTKGAQPEAFISFNPVTGIIALSFKDKSANVSLEEIIDALNTK